MTEDKTMIMRCPECNKEFIIYIIFKTLEEGD